MRMLLYRHRYLIISVNCLLLNHSIYTLAQQQVTLKDLPKCAISCADEAASAVGCRTTDTSCFCAHQLSTATIRCSLSECHPNSLALIGKVLSEMCTAATVPTDSIITASPPSPTSSSTSPATIIQSSQISTTTSPITPESISSQISSTSTTSSTTTSTVSSTTPNVVSSLSQTTTQLASSTVVIVTTVVINPTSTSTNGAGRLDVSISTRALFFCLPSLISLVAAI